MDMGTNRITARILCITGIVVVNQSNNIGNMVEALA